MGLVEEFVGDAELSSEVAAVGDRAGLASKACVEEEVSGGVVVAVMVRERREHQHGVVWLPR